MRAGAHTHWRHDPARAAQLLPVAPGGRDVLLHVKLRGEPGRPARRVLVAVVCLHAVDVRGVVRLLRAGFHADAAGGAHGRGAPCSGGADVQQPASPEARARRRGSLVPALGELARRGREARRRRRRACPRRVLQRRPRRAHQGQQAHGDSADRTSPPHWNGGWGWGDPRTTTVEPTTRPEPNQPNSTRHHAEAHESAGSMADEYGDGMVYNISQRKNRDYMPG